MRIVHQSGVKINPLAHSALPDAEANIIRNLMERIDVLEGQLINIKKLLTERRQYDENKEIYEAEGKSQSLLDKEIIEYLETEHKGDVVE